MMSDLESRLYEIVEACLDKSEKAFSSLSITVPERSHMRYVADDFLQMARAYFEDGRHFLDKDDPVLALEALAYSYGWLDAGARLGLFDVGEDADLFTLVD